MPIYTQQRPIRLFLNTAVALVASQSNRNRELDTLQRYLISAQKKYAARSGSANETADIAEIATLLYEFMTIESKLRFSGISKESLESFFTVLSQTVRADTYHIEEGEVNYIAPLYSVLFDAVIDGLPTLEESKYFILLELYDAFSSRKFRHQNQDIIKTLRTAIRKVILDTAANNDLSALMQIFSSSAIATDFLTETDRLMQVKDEFGQTIEFGDLIAKLEVSDPCPAVAILCESELDWEKMQEAALLLQNLGIQYEARIVPTANPDFADTITYYSAHAHTRGIKAIIVGCTTQPTLAESCSSNCDLPIIGVPLTGSRSFMKGLDVQQALLEISEVVTVGINQAKNAAMHCARTLAQSDLEIRRALAFYKQREASTIVATQQQLPQRGMFTQFNELRYSPIPMAFEGPNGSLHSNLSSVLLKDSSNLEQPNARPYPFL